MAEIGGGEDVELRRRQGLADRPVMAGAPHAAGRRLGHVLGDLKVGPLGRALEPGRGAHHQGAGGADDKDRRHGDDPQHPPLAMEAAHHRQGHPRSRDPAQRARGKEQAQRQAPAREGRGDHVGPGDQGHHLIADPAEAGAEKIEADAVGQRQAGEAGGHGRRPQQQGHSDPEAADQQGRQEGRGAHRGAEDGEAEAGLGPVPVLAAHHGRQHDAQRIEGRSVDQEADQAEGAQKDPPARRDHAPPMVRTSACR